MWNVITGILHLSFGLLDIVSGLSRLALNYVLQKDDEHTEMLVAFQLTGLSVWGSDDIPKEIVAEATGLRGGINRLRGWAQDNKLISLDRQMIPSQQVDRLARVFSTEDNLFYVVHISKNSEGALDYQEYPGVPITLLINKSLKVKLRYWRCFSDRIEFGFLLDGFPGITFASFAQTVRIVSEFKKTMELLKNQGCSTVTVHGREFGVAEEMSLDGQSSGQVASAMFMTMDSGEHDVDIHVETS